MNIAAHTQDWAARCACGCRFHDHAHKPPHACTNCKGRAGRICVGFLKKQTPFRGPVAEAACPWRKTRGPSPFEAPEIRVRNYKQERACRKEATRRP